MVTFIDIQGTGAGDQVSGLQAVLEQVYRTMIVHCRELIGVSQGIAGFGALWYIGFRIWKSIARAEGIDLFPLLRPLVIGYMIVIFPSVISLINGVMQPTVSGTASLVKDSDQAVATLLQQKAEVMKESKEWQMYIGTDGNGNLDKWEELSGAADSGFASGISNRVKFEMAKASYNLKNSVKVWLAEILQMLFEAASLCINTVRVFYLVVLAIFGPLAFGLSVYDGLQDILMSWLAKYLNVFLWLPVANIFGSLTGQIQQEMIRLDIAQINATGQTSFGPTDTAYIVFLLLAISGYFTVPMITNYIIRAGGHGARRWGNKMLTS